MLVIDLAIWNFEFVLIWGNFMKCLSLIMIAGDWPSMSEFEWTVGVMSLMDSGFEMVGFWQPGKEFFGISQLFISALSVDFSTIHWANQVISQLSTDKQPISWFLNNPMINSCEFPKKQWEVFNQLLGISEVINKFLVEALQKLECNSGVC